MYNAPQQDNKKLLIGKINGFFGIKGWVKIFSYTEPKVNILSYQPWWLFEDDSWKSYKILDGREQSKTIVVQLEGVNDRNQSQKFIGRDIYIDKSQLPELTDGQFYWHELTGFHVINLEKVELGKVDYLVDTGANHVLVVKGDKEHWIPYIEPFLVSIEKDTKKIIVDWDENF